MDNSPEISMFKDAYNAEVLSNTQLLTFYEAVQDGRCSYLVDRIRAIQQKEEREELKRQLKAFTISGTFHPTRAAANLQQHSGRICLDLDGKDNPQVEDWAELRDTIGTWREVEFTALSASGKGLFCVVLLKFPEKHREQFEALNNDFRAMGLRLDLKPKSLASLRFMSSDSGAIYNPDCEPYKKIYQEPKKYFSPVKRDNSGDKLEGLINKIVIQGIDITNSYGNWFEVGSALANEYGERGREYFHQLSKFHPTYSVSRCDKQYNNCLKYHYKYTAGTLFHYAKQHSITI